MSDTKTAESGSGCIVEDRWLAVVVPGESWCDIRDQNGLLVARALGPDAPMVAEAPHTLDLLARLYGSLPSGLLDTLGDNFPEAFVLEIEEHIERLTHDPHDAFDPAVGGANARYSCDGDVFTAAEYAEANDGEPLDPAVVALKVGESCTVDFGAGGTADFTRLEDVERNERGLTLAEWCAIAGEPVSPKAESSWWAGDDPTPDITNEQIEALAIEAATAGDEEQQALCDRALAGEQGARDACATAILNARAQVTS